jgi:gliding motility-associated-like protein
LSTGATFYANIPGTPSNNSNPVFNLLPPPFICSGLPFVFDHSATDFEGDSLVYELCVPYNGASQNDPMPQPPYAPPYSNIFWQPPFQLFNMLGGIAMAIDPQTGLLTATPNTIGQFVIGICVNEFRNGVLISKTRRDYQINVVACPTLVVAALQTPILTCGSNTVSFINNSFGAGSYFWDFGDPTTSGDTSTIKNPSYTYPDTGTYSVTLIAFSGFNPGCADTTVGVVTLLPDYNPIFTYVVQPCSYIVAFDDTSNLDSGPTTDWLWNFGDNTTSNIPDPVHTFPGPGTYIVTLKAESARGCEKTITQTIIIDPLISANASVSQMVSCINLCDASATVTVQNSVPPLSYVWDDPLNQNTPTATNLCPGTYIVTVTDSVGCVTTDTVEVTNPDSLLSTSNSTDAYCNGLCIGTTTVVPSGGTGPYTYVWNDPQNQDTPTATNLCPGNYQVTVTDANGCTTSESVQVVFSTFIPPLNASVSDSIIFIGQTVNLISTIYNGYIYAWTPPDGLTTTTIHNPQATPSGNITYVVTITDPNGCTNIDSVSIAVKEILCEEPEIFIPNAFTPDGDLKNDVVYVRGNTIRELTFRIYNRWGEKVFETLDPTKGWDGSYNGEKLAPAVYVYYFEAICFDNQKFYKQGNITLIR